jgi:simple sugar transport system permease protein
MLHELQSTDLWFLTFQAATSLLLVALGVYLPLRTGVLNLGAEGIMLISCFGAVLVAAKTSGSTAFGVLAGAGAGMLVCAAFALASITLRANGLVIGIALNFLAAGGTATATAALYGVGGTISTSALQPLPAWDIPVVSDLPWVGAVLSGQTPLTYLSWLLAPAVALWLSRTRGGLTLRVTGSRPDVAEAMGRPVARTQWASVVVGGALIGLGGAQLALAAAPQFSPSMTSGRGFIALAVALIAGQRCTLLLPLAVVFSLFDALGVDLQDLGLPTELSGVLPYLAIVVLLLAPRVVDAVRGAAKPAVSQP